MNSHEPRSLVFALAGAILISCTGDDIGYTSGQRSKISCDEFPVKIRSEFKAGYPVDCAKKYFSDPTLTATYFHMFFRFVLDDRSYANIDFRQAGEGTFFRHSPVTRILHGFKRVRTKGYNWGLESELRIGERKYEYVTFDLPKKSSCIGFVHNIGFKWTGHEKIFNGYICSTKTELNVSHLRDLLIHVNFDET